MSKLVGVGVLFLAATLSTAAQTPARMAGSVTKPDGTPVDGVKVRLQADEAKSVTVSATSNKAGRYVIGMVRPGSYRLEIDARPGQSLLRMKGKAVDTASARRVVWEVDQEIAAGAPPIINVGAHNQIDLDLVVGQVPAPQDTAAGSLAPEGKAEDAYATALERVRDKDFQGAISLLQPLAEKSPEDARVQYLLAFSLERLQKWNEALAAVEKVLASDPHFVGAHFLRGRILKGQGRVQDAEAEFRKEIESGTDEGVVVDSRLALATLYRDAKRVQDAIAMLEPIAEKLNRADVFAELATLYSAAGDPGKALASLERAERAGGGDDAALLNLAIGYLNDDKYQDAEAIAKRLLTKGSSKPNLSVAHSILARCALNRGDVEEGRGHLEKALELDPASTLAPQNREILETLKE